MKKLTIEIASPTDRESLVAEIWYGNQMIAEISKRNEIFELEIYINKNGNIKLELDIFLDVLKKAKEKLY